MTSKYEISLLVERVKPVEILKAQVDLVNRPSVFQFNGEEERTCSRFGCGRILSLRESLAGSKCIHCMNLKKPRLSQVIKYR